MKVYIVITQLGWKADHIQLEGVYSKCADARKAQKRFYKKMWKDITIVEGKRWPGYKEADFELFDKSGLGVWIETRVVRNG